MRGAAAPLDRKDILARHLQDWPGQATAGTVGAGRGGPVVVGPAQEPFAWASVTKLLVALTIWVAVEERTVAWADRAGPPGATLAHLLSHASGLPFEGSSPVAPPGARRIYSNTGIEVAAGYLAERAGMSFEVYLQGAVLGPLGMGATRLQGSPAHGASGPLVDLMALAHELMRPTLVAQPTWARATCAQWPGLAGVVPGFGRYDHCDWGLGPEVRSGKHPHWTGTSNSTATFGHFGQSGSMLWVDPVKDVALVSLCSEPFGAWAKQAWPALADAVLAGQPLMPADKS